MSIEGNLAPIIAELTSWLSRDTARGGARKASSAAAALATDVGEIRTDNQDRCIVVQGRGARGRPYLLIALSDGIGGMSNGAACASLTLGALTASLQKSSGRFRFPEEWLFTAAHFANRVVFERYKGNGGATLVAALITETSACWLSTGDSRVYQYANGQLAQLSRDDTIAAQLADRFQGAPDQNQLLQYMGMGDGIEIHLEPINTAHGGLVVLTSDGAHFLSGSSASFGMIIAHAEEPHQVVRRLVELAKWCGGPDNATAVAVAIGASLKRNFERFSGAMEISDPFGDLRIVFPDTLVPDLANPGLNPRKEALADGGGVGTPAIGNRAELDQPVGRKARKAKSKKKPRDPDSLGAGGAELEELQIDFLNKDETDE